MINWKVRWVIPHNFIYTHSFSLFLLFGIDIHCCIFYSVFEMLWMRLVCVLMTQWLYCYVLREKKRIENDLFYFICFFFLAHCTLFTIRIFHFSIRFFFLSYKQLFYIVVVVVDEASNRARPLLTLNSVRDSKQ